MAFVMNGENRTTAVIRLSCVDLLVGVAFGNHCQTSILYTDKIDELKKADFLIAVVPTLGERAHVPELATVQNTSFNSGKAIKTGDIVVYESTVYKSATEESGAPVLERESGLKCSVDFSIGNLPEWVNPGDTEPTFFQD